MLTVMSPLSVPAGGYGSIWIGISRHQFFTFALLDHLLRQFKHALSLRQRGSELSIANWCLKNEPSALHEYRERNNRSSIKTS
jgi:hypothetical protein